MNAQEMAAYCRGVDDGKTARYDELSEALRVEAATSQQLREAATEMVAACDEFFPSVRSDVPWPSIERLRAALAGSVSLPPTETK